MSRFLGLSKEECLVLEEEEIERPLTCPTCIPDLSAPNIDWLSQTKPYFDPKTCEYIINYLAPDKVQGLKEPLKEYVKKAKVMGARQLIKHFNKQNFDNMGNPNSDGYKKIKTSMRNVIVDRSNLIRIRVSIDAVDFDKLPERIVDPNENTPPDNTASDLPTQLRIDDREGNFNINFITTQIALRGYEQKQNMFLLTKGGIVRKEKEGQFSIFKINKFAKKIKRFKEKLDTFLSDNGFDFLSPLSFFSFNRKIQTLRIELDNSDEENPLKINKIFVEFEGCPEIELVKGLDDFKQKAYDQEAIFFFANFNRFFYDVTGEETKDWLEFLDEYVYPPVLVDYGESPEDELISESNPNCPAITLPFGDILENLLKDLTYGAADLYELAINKDSCSQNPEKSNPTVKQFINPVKQREFEKAYRKELEIRKKAFSNRLKEFDELPDRDPNETDEDYQKKINAKKEEKEQLLQKLDREAQETANFIIENDVRNNPDKYNPLIEQWKQASSAKFNPDNSIFEIWGAIQNSDDILGEFTKFQNYINVIGLCGLNEGMQKALDCLFKQVTFHDALNAAINVAFETLPPDFFEANFLPGLTSLQQTEIRSRVAKKLGTNLENVKWPWEMRQNNKEIARRKAQEDAIRKQYVADLEEDLKKGDENASKLFYDEQARQIRLFLKENPDKTGESLTVQDYEQITETTYKTLEDRQVNRQLARPETDISQDLQKIGEEMVKAYVDILFEYLSIDDLLETCKSIPMVGLLYKFAESFIECPTKVLQDLEQNEIKEFKLDICNPIAPVINVKIPQIDFSISPLKLITENISKIVRETIVSVLSRLIGTILKYLEDSLCKLAEMFGKLALRPDQFFGDLPGTFRKAFCPNASNEEAAQIGNNLLNKIGLGDDDISSAIDCLGGALAGSFTQEELISLMVDENPSPSLLDRVADAIRIGCPRFADVFGDRDGAGNIFNNLRDLLPQGARDRLTELTNIPGNMPLYDTICLTSEELENWDNIRRGNLEAAGLSQEEASEQVENYNQRALEALRDIMKDLMQGPEQSLEDALNNIFAPNDSRPPGCDLKDGESNYGSKAVKEPESLIQVQDELSNRIMDIIGDSFDREFCDNPNPFSPSLIHRIMRDTDGNDYGYHNFLEQFFLTRMDHHHSKGDQETKTNAPWYTKFFGANDLPWNTKGDTAYYPATIGKELETQASNLSEYESQENLLPLLESVPLDYKVPFQAGYLYERGNYGSVGYYSDYEDSLMDYSIVSNKIGTEQKLLRESVDIEEDIKEILDGYDLQVTKKKRKVFGDFLREKLSLLENVPEINFNQLFDKTCEAVFQSTQKLIFTGSEGLVFGYEEEDLTASELKYVGPNGEDPYTNYFKEEDKKLGRAETPSDRVFFLNPEQYGGSYQVPPVYIKPKRNKGWLKISSVMSPEKAACAPESDSIIYFSDLKSHVNNVRNSINHDPRISNSVEKCFIEKPFDKILSKNAASCIDGISRMHVRMSISKIFTKTIPAVANIKYNQINFGNCFEELVFDEMKKELSTVNPFWPAHIKTHIYEMIVYEQLVQSYERQFINSLPSGSVFGKDVSSLPEAEAKAWESISTVREEYSYERVIFPPGQESIPSISTIENPINNEYFPVYALAYKKWGEQIFDESFQFNWSGAPMLPGYPPTPIMPFVDYKTFCVALAVRLVLDDVKVLVKKIINVEAKKMIDKFYENFDPKVENLTEYLLTSKDLFHKNNVRNFGSTDYHNKIKMAAVPTIGDAEDVVKSSRVMTPWEDSPQDRVIFKLEKYVRFVKKQEGGNEILNQERVYEGTIRDYFGNQGVQPIQEAQEFIDLQKEEYGDLYISDLFGNAELTEDLNDYTGHMGISYGIRIVMKVPENLITSELLELSQNDSKLSIYEKAFYCKNDNRYFDASNSNNFSIPIVSTEIELKDKQIKDINFLNGEDSYDLRCLMDKLVKSTEYRLLFKYLCPIKAASSMMMIYSNNFFLESIGMNDGWSSPPEGEQSGNIEKKKDLFGNWDHEVGANFDDTAKICRKYFSSFYYSTKFIHDENYSLPKVEFPDFLKLLFGSFQFPEININIELPEIKFSHKIIKKNPLNKNDEVCEEPVDKFLS